MLSAVAAHAQAPAWADGRSFEGPVTLHFTAPGRTARTVHGTGSARWLADAGSARFVLQADEPRTNTRVHLVFEGNITGSGWRSAAGPVTLAVNPDGRITGGGTDPALQRTLAFAGVVHETTLHLQTHTALARAEGGLPVGTEITAEYALTRPASSLSSAGEDCRRQGMNVVPSRSTGLPPRGTCP